MAHTSADHEAMVTAAQQVESHHQEIHQLQNRLQEQMANVSSRWTGSDSAAFLRDYSHFDTEIERVKQGLDMIHMALVEAQRHDSPHKDDDADTNA